MLHTSNPIIKHKAGLLNLAKELENVKLYSTIDVLQGDLDEWINNYNNERTHQGKMCCGRTPVDTFLDGKTIWDEKNLAQI